VELERIVSDMKDFEPSGVAQLGSGQPWVGMGKHLCGAATDFALLCMARCAASSPASSAEGPEAPPHDRGSCPALRLPEADAYEQASSSRVDRSEADHEAARPRRGLQGFAIATCCHHRCSWGHYVGWELFRQHGMSEADFQLVAWMTGEPCLGAVVNVLRVCPAIVLMLMDSGCRCSYVKKIMGAV
jgi:tRNA:m4X modification enzyme